MMITLKNDYHDTECKLRLKQDRILSAYQIKKAWNTLCGIDDCTCGNDAGMRGKHDFYLDFYQENGRIAFAKVVF